MSHSLLDREDLAQLKAIARWQAEAAYDAASHLPRDAWVGTRVRQRSVDALRSAGRRRRLDTQSLDAPGTAEPVDRRDAYERFEDRLLVAQALAKLTPKQRDVITGTVLAGETVAAWAAANGVHVKAAETRRHGALRRLAAMPEILTLVGAL